MDIIRSNTSDSLYFWLEDSPSGNIVPAYEAHTAYEIYIIYGGERHMYLGSSLYHVRRGDAVMIPSETPHRSFGDTPYKGICIEFSGGYIRSVFSPEKCRAILSCFDKPVIRLDEDALKLIHTRTVKAKETKAEQNISLSVITDILFGFCTAAKLGAKPSFDSDISAISMYIQKNYLNIKGLGEIADRFGISESHLCRVFRARTGVTVTHYINALKMQYAYKHLIETNMPIKEIYKKCGYANSQYFNRVFKKFRGVTPHKARADARETEMWDYEE